MEYENPDYVYSEIIRKIAILKKSIKSGHIVTDVELLEIEELTNDLYSHI